MKKLLSLFLSAILFFCFPLTAGASEREDAPASESAPDAGFETVASGVERLVESYDEDGGRYVITGKVTVREDTVIPQWVSLYIRDGGSLIIRNGAEVTISASSQITIERGGKLFVTDGALNTSGTLYNYGKLIIRKDGVCRCYNSYRGNAGSRIVLEGEAYFGRLPLNDAVHKIQKFDPEFRLKNYCIESYNVRGAGGQIYFYYCIGNVRTDYYYRTRTDTDEPKYGRKKLDLKTVYSDEIRKKVSEMAEKDYSENIAELADPAPNLFQINTTYQYSYKKDRLFCEWTWFEYDDFDDLWMEKLRDGYYGHARRH